MEKFVRENKFKSSNLRSGNTPGVQLSIVLVKQVDLCSQGNKYTSLYKNDVNILIISSFLDGNK